MTTLPPPLPPPPPPAGRRPPRFWVLLSRLLIRGEAAPFVREDLEESYGRDRIKVKALHALKMHLCNASAVTRNTNKSNQSLISSPVGSLKRTTRSHNDVPVTILGEIMKLNHVELLDLHAL